MPWAEALAKRSWQEFPSIFYTSLSALRDCRLSEKTALLHGLVCVEPVLEHSVALSRLHRELQRAPSRRAARRRNLLLAPRGPNRHRELAAPLQHDQAACLTWILPSPHGRLRYAERLRRPRWLGATANIKLTFHLDRSAGADQPTESAEQKFAACEPLTKTFNSRLLIRNRGPGSRPPWESP